MGKGSNNNGIIQISWDEIMNHIYVFNPKLV